MATKIISAKLNLAAIHWGEISASKKVRKHFNFPEGCRAVAFEVSDQLGNRYTLKAKRRLKKYPKEAIIGLKTYIKEKGLVQGDIIIISKMDKLFGAVLHPPFYSIHYEKAAQGGGNFAGAEAGEN